MQEDYPRLYDGEYGPTKKALTAAFTPSGAFFYFMQPTLWEDIAEKSTNYFTEKMDERLEGQYNKQVEREKNHPNFKRKEAEQIKTELEKIPDISARELCLFVGLLIARTIAPNKEKLAHHGGRYFARLLWTVHDPRQVHASLKKSTLQQQLRRAR
jgi:hypothetical protein